MLTAQEVLESYQRAGVPLAYSLSSFLPVVRVVCPLMVVALPLRPTVQLRSKELVGGEVGRDSPSDVHYELVAAVDCLDLRTR